MVLTLSRENKAGFRLALRLAGMTMLFLFLPHAARADCPAYSESLPSVGYKTSSGEMMACNGSNWVAIGRGNVPTFRANLGHTTDTTNFPVSGAVFKLPETVDTQGNYNPATGVFTAPYAGYYFFGYTIAAMAGSLGMGDFNLLVNNTYDENKSVPTLDYRTSQWMSLSSSTVLYLAANDTVALSHSCCSGSDQKPGGAWRAQFFGYYLHP